MCPPRPTLNFSLGQSVGMWVQERWGWFRGKMTHKELGIREDCVARMQGSLPAGFSPPEEMLQTFQCFQTKQDTLEGVSSCGPAICFGPDLKISRREGTAVAGSGYRKTNCPAGRQAPVQTLHASGLRVVPHGSLAGGLNLAPLLQGPKHTSA